jgi:RAS protein activator-like 2
MHFSNFKNYFFLIMFELKQYIRDKYLSLTVTLEPSLSVRLKDDLANSLVRIAHKLGMQTRFLTDLIVAEVVQLEDASLTFRGNSLATKAIESYMKLVGEAYLRSTLSDCVRYIMDAGGADLEIDPAKVTHAASLAANRDELVQILHVVCGRVFNSYGSFPRDLRRVFASLRAACLRHGKTDEMCDTLVSASVFLRLICPAILSPNLFNLTQEYPQEGAARKLTLTAKTMQTIANFSK